MRFSIANCLVGFVAFIHLVIAIVEIFFWSNPRVHSRLGFNADEARKVAPIVANVGLYNSFLAGGLIWGLSVAVDGVPIQIFSLTCVIIAGLVGAATIKWKILLL